MFAELQAEVAEKAIEALKAWELNSPSLKVRLRVWGMRCVGLPFKRRPAMPSSCSSKRSRSRLMVAPSSAKCSDARAKAAPMAAI
ncbi:hypothetical protein D3C71_1933870 [compost metagenome]